MTIGIDIGGTKIEGVLWNTKIKQVIRAIRYPTPQTRGGFRKVLKHLLEQLSKNARITDVGVGIPGSFDYKKKKILSTPNILYLKGFDIISLIQETAHTRVAVDNDVNCMARSELYLSANWRIKNKTIFVIAPGTGIGGAIIFDGKIFNGATHSAGEIGDTILKLETCNMKHSAKRFKFHASHFRTIENLYQYARDKKDYKIVGILLGIAIANVIKILNPDIIFIGGGLAALHKKFMPEVQKMMEKFVFPLSARKTPIKIIRRKRSAAIGAALLFNK